MTADVQSWGTNGQAGNEDDLSSCIGNRASRSKNQEPLEQISDSVSLSLGKKQRRKTSLESRKILSRPKNGDFLK